MTLCTNTLFANSFFTSSLPQQDLTGQKLLRQDLLYHKRFVRCEGWALPLANGLDSLEAMSVGSGRGDP